MTNSKTIRFRTETGSVYKIDTENKKACRESGKKPPTARFHGHECQDSHMKPYNDISTIGVGLQVVIIWNIADTPLLDEYFEGADPSTITSQVVEILDDLN